MKQLFQEASKAVTDADQDLVKSVVEQALAEGIDAAELLEQGFAPAEISSILSLNRSLLNEYIQIVKEHYPEVVTKNGHLQPQPQIST